MELDDHISKYIDSELTEEEDVLLRKLLSEDDFAREKFDSAVSVHMAMKDDSESIEPPEDLLRQTEDIVLMKILASQPIVIERPFLWRRSQALAALIAFFIISFVFQIDDMKLGNLGNNIGFRSSEINTENIEPASAPIRTNHDLAESSPRIINRRESPTLGGGSGLDLAVSSISSTASEGKGSVEADESVIVSNEISAEKKDDSRSEGVGTLANTDDTPKPPSPLVNNIINGKPQEEEPKPSGILYSQPSVKDKPESQKNVSKPEYLSDNNLLANKTRKIENINVAVPVNPGAAVTEVIFSSFLGTDFVRTGLGDGEKLAITNFSQSIAYSVNSNEKLGIEIGYSEYGYKENVRLPSPNQPLSKKVPMVEVSDLEIPIGADLIEYTMIFENQRQMVWGSAFYERSLIKSRDLSLEGRIGLGMSHDGPLGYGRLFGMYEFLDGFSLTVGTEGRLFNVNIPGESISRRLKSTATIIYGFQINF